MPDTPGRPCSDEEALEIIRALVGRPDLALTAHGAMSESRPWERDFTAGPASIFTVDVERREVVIATMPPGLAGPGGVLDCDQARQAAREFAAAHVQGFDRLALLYDTLADLSVWWRHNDRSQGQVLRWQVRLQSDEPLSAGVPQITKKAAYTIDAHTGEVLEEMR